MILSTTTATTIGGQHVGKNNDDIWFDPVPYYILAGGLIGTVIAIIFRRLIVSRRYRQEEKERLWSKNKNGA